MKHWIWFVGFNLEFCFQKQTSWRLPSLVFIFFFIELNGQRDQKNLLALLQQIVCEDCLMYAKYELSIK